MPTRSKSLVLVGMQSGRAVEFGFRLRLNLSC